MRYWFLFFFFFTIGQIANGQYLFSTIKPSDGLVSRETRAVFRDNEGYVWIGTTAGVNRFDGAHFKLWNKSTPGYPRGLGETITSIVEHKSKIYFGTDECIGALDKTTGRITQIPVLTAGNDTRYVTRLVHDNQKRLWAATNYGLRIETDKGFAPVSEVYPFARVLDSLYIHQATLVFDASRNCFWIGAVGNSYCLDLKNRKLFSVENNPEKNPFFTKDNILSIALDKKNNLWFSNATQATLCHYNFSTKAFDSIRTMNGNPDWTFNGGANALLVDSEDRLWISTWTYTAYVRQPNGSFEQLTYNPSAPHSISYGIFAEAFEDKYNNIWFATINGVSKLEHAGFFQKVILAPSYKFYLPTGFANINSVQPDGDNWWAAKMDGLVHYNGKTKSFKRFIISGTNLLLNDFFDTQVLEDEVWCATNSGVQILDKKKEVFRPLKHTADDSSYSGYVSCIKRDEDGYMWSCIWKKVLCRYNLKTKACTHFVVPDWLKKVRSIYQTSDKKFWIGTTSGAVIFNPANGTFVSVAPFVKEPVSSIAEDQQKNVWLATVNYGLIKCSADGKVTDSITRNNGLQKNWITDMVVDDFNRMWIISREGLFCVAPATKNITKVTIPVTYSFNDHWNSLVKKGPLIYGAMLDNMVLINTARYQVLPTPTPPLISSFSVFGTETPLTSNVELSYKQNFFSFEFASPFHTEATAMQYAYKLEGFDKDWVYSGRNLTAAYTNVPDGHYTFLVKSTGADGEWMKEVTSINILIHPPFWKTWWFITLLAIAVALVISYLYRFRQKQKREKRMDETIDYFANSFYGENSVNEICWDIARNCISQLKLEDCVVYLLDEKRNVLSQKAAYGPKNPKEHEISNPIDIKLGEGIVGAAAASGKPILIKDTSKDSRYIVDDAQRLSELAVPIIHEGKAIGVIDSEHSRRNFFGDEHIKVLSTIAAISASKIAEAKAEEAAKESQLQLLEIKKLYAESQLMALRAQMNPHFVFNCLNSIQECIVTQKYGEASLYLNKFAKLFRSVLNNSGKVFVTLAEEIEVLDLYLTLEHMRFEKSFSYEIDVDEELESEEILVPSMLLQPYVENALWHGLMHKEGERKLLIAFSKKNNDIFECVIDDNGIGRKKALELKEQQSKTKRHVSRGMTISKDRIELLQKQGQHAALNIIDKYAGDAAAGTKVVIELSAYLQ